MNKVFLYRCIYNKNQSYILKTLSASPLSSSNQRISLSISDSIALIVLSHFTYKATDSIVNETCEINALFYPKSLSQEAHL